MVSYFSSFDHRREKMILYKHILLSTDLSDASEQVAVRAAELAKATKAELSVIHVIEHVPLAYGGEFSVPIDPNVEQTIEGHARTSLNHLGEKFAIPVTQRYLETGVVKVAVLDLAKKLKADLIVVGTHKHHGIDILLGSRANAILHHATCDVLAVRVRE
jgi:universal stress protein A